MTGYLEPIDAASRAIEELFPGCRDAFLSRSVRTSRRRFAATVVTVTTFTNLTDTVIMLQQDSCSDSDTEKFWILLGHFGQGHSTCYQVEKISIVTNIKLPKIFISVSTLYTFHVPGDTALAREGAAKMTREKMTQGVGAAGTAVGRTRRNQCTTTGSASRSCQSGSPASARTRSAISFQNAT